jgi:hypothetical protein
MLPLMALPRVLVALAGCLQTAAAPTAPALGPATAASAGDAPTLATLRPMLRTMTHMEKTNEQT